MIRRFDGFRRMLNRAAEGYHHQIRGAEQEGDLMPINRILAGLGGPPANQRPAVTFREADSLPLLLLFLLTQPLPVRGVLTGDLEAHAARLKQLIHLLGQAVVPMVSGGSLSFDETVRTLSPALVALHPLISYDDEGEVTAVSPTGTETEVALIHDPGGALTLVITGDQLHEVAATITQESTGWLSYLMS